MTGLDYFFNGIALGICMCMFAVLLHIYIEYPKLRPKNVLKYYYKTYILKWTKAIDKENSKNK